MKKKVLLVVLVLILVVLFVPMIVKSLDDGWVESGGKWYHYDTNGEMDTGFYSDGKEDGYTYYLCEGSPCTTGELLTGWQTIDGYDFYFKTTAADANDDEPLGAMYKGLREVGNSLHFFRTIVDDEMQGPGPIGSLVKNRCVEENYNGYCFDENGNLTNEYAYVSYPDSSMCSNPMYTGSEQSITKTAGLGYVWQNNMHTGVGVYTVSAVLKEGYKWFDDTVEPKLISCSIRKAVIQKPTVTQTSFTYTGGVLTPIINNFNSDYMIKTGNYEATNEGYYHMQIGLKDKIDISWADGSSGDIVVDWSIGKATLAAPVVTSYSGLYNGLPHSITVEEVEGGEIHYSLDNSDWVKTKPTRTTAGTTTVYVKIIGDRNHNDSPVATGTIEIKSDAYFSIEDYDVDSTNRLITVPLGTTVGEFTPKVAMENGLTLDVAHKDKNGQQILYTGGKIKFMSGTVVYKEYSIVIVGDTSGDGDITYLDYVKVYNHIQKTKNPSSNKQLLTGAYLKAADMSGDGRVNYMDYVKVYNKIKELKGGTN